VEQSESGDIYEQWISMQDEDGKAVRLRRISVKLKQKTRSEDSELLLLTNLPKSAASAEYIAELYCKRWNIETMFQQLESYLHSEINTLGYPKAALFGFCVALVSYNIMAVIKAAMRHVHGEEIIENEVSGYYILNP
jgi:IS4 transposase